MKTIYTYTPTTLTFSIGGSNYTFKKRGGRLLIEESQVLEIPETVAMLLILCSGERLFFIERETYFAIRERVWTFLDRTIGGLNDSGVEHFRDNDAVFAAAEQHKAAIQARYRTDADPIHEGPADSNSGTSARSQGGVQ